MARLCTIPGRSMPTVSAPQRDPAQGRKFRYRPSCVSPPVDFKATIRVPMPSEQGRHATQLPAAVTIPFPDVAAAGCGPRTIVDLIIDAAVVGANVMALIVA